LRFLISSRQRHPDTFTLSVSHTTRGPRPGEEHGVHYYFVTKEEFLDLKANQGFVEKYAIHLHNNS
jgi:guanylate kinase